MNLGSKFLRALHGPQDLESELVCKVLVVAMRSATTSHPACRNDVNSNERPI